MRSIERWEQVLTRHTDARLRAIPGLELYAQPGEDSRPRLGIFSCNVRRPLDEVARALEDAGVEAVTGHNGAVRTMTRLAAGGVCLRLSIAHYNTEADIDRAVDRLEYLALRTA
jgi:selenocysteine lyase/cysteine desulfurase